MFQFAGLASCTYLLDARLFGDPRIKAYLQLPEVYRSLSRPSSPLNAKTSTIYPYYLDHIFF